MLQGGRGDNFFKLKRWCNGAQREILGDGFKGPVTH